MKLFKTNNIEFCQDHFGFDKPSVLSNQIKSNQIKFIRDIK